jgi:hypothetical protein
MSYLVVGVVAFLGILAGKIIALMTEEELKPGRKYFVLIKKISLVLMMLAAIIYLYDQIFYLLIILAGFLIVLLSKKFKINNLAKLFITYVLFALILYYSMSLMDLFIIESVLIFIYGLTVPTTSLF